MSQADVLDTRAIAVAVRLDQLVEELAAWEPDATSDARPYIEMAGDLLSLAARNMHHPGLYSVTLREAIDEGAVRVIARKMVDHHEVTP